METNVIPTYREALIARKAVDTIGFNMHYHKALGNFYAGLHDAVRYSNFQFTFDATAVQKEIAEVLKKKGYKTKLDGGKHIAVILGNPSVLPK